MKFVTITMIMAHAGKCRSAVVKALATAGIKGEKQTGVKGLRFKLSEVNAWLPKQWPERGTMKLQVEAAASNAS